MCTNYQNAHLTASREFGTHGFDVLDLMSRYGTMLDFQFGGFPCPWFLGNRHPLVGWNHEIFLMLTESRPALPTMVLAKVVTEFHCMFYGAVLR